MMDMDGRIEAKIDRLVDSHTELRLQVGDMATKMGQLVGPDGSNGVVGKIQDRLTAVEGRQIFLSGGFGVAGVGIGALLHYAAKKLLGVSW